MTTADNGSVGSAISLNVLIEFIITSGNSIASSRLWIAQSLTISLSLSFSLSLSLSLSTLLLLWEWVDHTDLIRQPCNDEICTTVPLGPQRTYSRDGGGGGSGLALAWGQTKTADSNLPSDLGEGQFLGLPSVRKRLTGKINNGWKEEEDHVKNNEMKVEREEDTAEDKVKAEHVKQ